MHLRESGEMYLETILVLTREKNREVHSLDVAEYMNYSKPSVSRAVGLLKKGGYLEVSKDGALTLTEAGREIAEKIYERHTLLTGFFTMLGVDKEIAAEDACKAEHILSEQTLEKIRESALRNDAAHPQAK